MDVLSAQVEQLNSEIATERARGNFSEADRKAEEVTALLAQIDELKKQEMVANVTAEGIAEGISTGLESFEVGDTAFTLDDLAVDSDAADILRSGIKAIGKTQANKFLAEISTQKSVYEAQLATKQEQIGNLAADRDKLQNSNSQLLIERDDLAEKRDAAAQQLLEAQAEIARLNSHVDDLRNEIANGSTPNNIIDIASDADLEAAAQRLKAKKEQAAADKKVAEEAAKIRIYNVQQLDGTGAKFGANRADNDEYVTFGWLEKNQYVELSNDEVTRFREEANQAASQDIVESIQETAATSEELDFRPETPELQLPDATIQEHSVDGEMATTPVEDARTVEERLTALEAAVFGGVKAAA